MTTYYAVTRTGGSWKMITSGVDPADVYRGALDILESREVYSGEEEFAMAPDTEAEIDNLRVIPEEKAKQYFVNLRPMSDEEAEKS